MNRKTRQQIPAGLLPHFQEYDTDKLDLAVTTQPAVILSAAKNPICGNETLRSAQGDNLPEQLHLARDANLIIQRTLEFGTWDEVRWLVQSYGAPRVRAYLRQWGERQLSRVAFNYWRKFSGIRRWRRSPFPTNKGKLWLR